MNIKTNVQKDSFLQKKKKNHILTCNVYFIHFMVLGTVMQIFFIMLRVSIITENPSHSLPTTTMRTFFHIVELYSIYSNVFRGYINDRLLFL